MHKKPLTWLARKKLAQKLEKVSFTLVYFPFGVMARVQYEWKERLGYYNLPKSIDGAKQDARAVTHQGSFLSLAIKSTYCSTKVVIILRQAHLDESTKND